MHGPDPQRWTRQAPALPLSRDQRAPIYNRTMTCTALAWVVVLLLFPVLILLYATESRSTRIARLRRNGATWAAIGARYGVSRHTARRWAGQKTGLGMS